MGREKIYDLAALHALGLLEGEELLRFEKALREDPEARKALRLYEQTADLLVHTAEAAQPPPELEDKIFAQLPPQSPASPEKQSESEGAAPRRSASQTHSVLSWFPWGLAAALAIACIALWVDRTRQSEALAARSEALAEKESLLQSLEQEIVALEQERVLDNLRIAVLRSQLDTAPNAEAVAVWDELRQQGRLSVLNLPPVPEGKEYQLWLIDSAQEGPVSAGVFNTDEAGGTQYGFASASTVNQVDAFALSIEDEGGKPAPEGPIVLVGE